MITLLPELEEFEPHRVRSVRPNSKAYSSKLRLTLLERRFQEFDEFLFRDWPAIEEWADEATETAAPQGLAFEESGQAPPNVADG
jgi:hypothetical protein